MKNRYCDIVVSTVPDFSGKKRSVLPCNKTKLISLIQDSPRLNKIEELFTNRKIAPHKNQKSDVKR